MARGYLSGVIVGTLVSGLGLGTVSLVTSDQNVRAPETAALDVPAGSEFNQSRDDTAAALPASEDTPSAGAAPEVTAPEPDDLASLENADTQPAAQPETGQADGMMTAPETGDSHGSVDVDSEVPVLPTPQARAPKAPVDEQDLSISTDPAQPLMPDVSEDSAAFPASDVDAGAADTETDVAEVVIEEAIVAEVDAGDAQDSDEVSAEPAVEPAEPVEPVAEATDPVVELVDQITEPVAPVIEPVTEPVEPVAEPVIEPVVEPVAEPVEQVAEPVAEPVEQVAEPAAEPVEPVQPQPETAEEPAIETAAEASSTIGDLASNVKTNRLPSVGDVVVAEEPAAVVIAVDENATEDTRPPLEKYAAEFENPEGKPLMSIILIDDGSSPVGLQALESFPYPLSFAVDASWDGADGAMIKYRAAGFEVLALTNLPEGAGAQDAEVAMQSTLADMSEVVAVMDGTGSGLQSSRAAAEQLAPILLDSGHGAVLFPKGLNTAQKLLAREGVPSAAVFRDFDAKGQGATVIRRFLDQAAFKAGQEDAGVVMVGRLRPDTISALLLWGLQDRANRVALAPISAILRGGE